MKKLLLLLYALISINTFAQINVKEGSFHKIDGYIMLDKEDHRDDNWKPMALIKITAEGMKAEERARLEFHGNGATFIDVQQMGSQTYLYLTAQAATFIEIMHPDFGKTEYWFPEDLCDYCGYEMVVQYIPIVPISAPEPLQLKKYHLIVTADQSDATIYIDDKPINIGEASLLVTEGTTHTWKIECNLYHTETGSVTVNEKTVVNKTLRPAFGYINVSSSPEQGARVFVDGIYVGESPIRTDKLASGTHTVRVMKEMYMMTERSFTVDDGQTTNAILDMSANFVNVTINTDLQSYIYVDEEYKGKGKWTGRLSDGEHLFEARKVNHRASAKTIELVLGETKTITIEAPKPIYGSLEINSSPMNANIYIDGQSYGQTPNYINEIIIGEHELKLTKQGCIEIKKSITIKEGEALTISETLQNETELAEKQYELGIECFNKQEYSKAVEHFRKASEQGNADAQCWLGVCYYNGYGVTKSYTEAVKWIHKAAEQGNADAQYSLGLCYYSGDGVTQNKTKAVKWIQKAAEQGNADAQYSLGVCYYNGDGVSQNYKEAVKWYRKSAEQGVADAQHCLGQCCYKGEGVSQNYTDAVGWFRKAAEQEHDYAQGWLGFCYENGTGVTKDITKAKEWYQKSANNGNEFAKEALKNLQNTTNTQQTYYSNTNKDSGFIYGHEYVDLGLSVKWATCNVGANKPEDCGNYYAWGEISTKSTYTESNSKTYGKTMSDISGNVQYDAARANWGGNWRMPTKLEMQELIDNCTWIWTTQNGVNGYKVTSKINGSSIFLPAAGYRLGATLKAAGNYGYYWSSTPFSNNYTNYLYFISTYHSVSNDNRSYGRPLRPVIE